MRKFAATTVAAVLLAAAQTTPAHAAPPAAPSDVQVSWADAASGLIRVKWTDDGAANKVRLEYQKAWFPPDWLAVAGNELSHHWSVQGGQLARIAVLTTDATGDSVPAYSRWFDTDGPGAPKLTSATPQADGSLKFTWTNTPAPKDSTPNDPLDLPAGTVGAVGPKIWAPGDAKLEFFKHPLGTTAAVIPSRPRPYPAWVVETNEWTSAASGETDFLPMKLSVTGVPAYGVFGKPMTISGTAGADTCIWPDDGPCALWQGSGLPLTMQTRASASKPWEYAGRFTSYPFGFQAGTVAVGGREYRFYVPTWQSSYGNGDGMVSLQAISGSRYIPTLADFAVAGFNVRTAQVGQMVKLTVDVKPGGTVKGALQRWDGKYWRSVLTVPVVKGKATMSIRAAGRGTTTQYRVAVPGMTYYGLPIQTTGSRAFTLTVR